MNDICLQIIFVYFCTFTRTLMEEEVAHSVEQKSREPSPQSLIRSVQEDVPVLLLCLLTEQIEQIEQTEQTIPSQETLLTVILKKTNPLLRILGMNKHQWRYTESQGSLGSPWAGPLGSALGLCPWAVLAGYIPEINNTQPAPGFIPLMWE